MKKFSDVESFMQELEKKLPKMETSMERAMAKSCLTVQREIMEGMTDTQTDTSVWYGKHHPSVEGAYPAVDTGRLRASISFEVAKGTKSVYGEVGSTLKNPPYPFWLEYGTSQMAPRPWLRPSVEKSKETIGKLFSEAMSEGLKA